MPEYYVHLESGNDAGAGTEADPWKTVQKFFDTETEANGPHTLHVAGTATLPALSLNLTSWPVAAGQSLKPVVMRNWQGQNPPVITGAGTDCFFGASRYPYYGVDVVGMSFIYNGDTEPTRLHGLRAYNCSFGSTGLGRALYASFGCRIENCYLYTTNPTAGILRIGDSVLKGCVFDGRNTTHMEQFVAEGSYEFWVLDNLILLGNTTNNAGFNMASNHWYFSGNTIVGMYARSRIYSGLGGGTSANNVWITNQPGGFYSHGPTRFRGNRFIGYTSIENPTAGVPELIDLGGNEFIESPYRDWENLDFTVTRPDLLELPAVIPAGLVSSARGYAGCFAPVVDPLRQTAFSPYLSGHA